MSPRFSIVYPTRHRPEFIEQALRLLEAQEHDDFEVIVSDNFIDPRRSCERVCRNSPLARLTYVRPPEPLGMVGSWTFAHAHARGEYVSVLTDKTFLLPGALRRVDSAIEAGGEPEIVSWTSDFYFPSRYPDYFGDGVYGRTSPGFVSAPFRHFSPRQELDTRGRATVSRPEQSVADYCRGKLAFGVYRRDLTDRIAVRFGALFHNVIPDYTSLVLGLSESRSAVEMGASCVVSVNTEISTGLLVDTNDRAALEFIDSLEGGATGILPNLFVPGLYASLHNLVAHAYSSLRDAFDLSFAFDQTNWLAYCHEDIYSPARQWSDPSVEAEQKGRLEAHLASLGTATAAAVADRVAERAAAPAPRRPLRQIAGRMVPRRWRRRQPVRAPTIHDAVARAVATGG